MFIYSSDELIAEQQYNLTTDMFLKLSECCNLKYSHLIDEAFQYQTTFEYLTDCAKIMEKNDQKITIVIIPRCQDYYRYGEPNSDIKQGYTIQNLPLDIIVPYIEYSFSNNYHNPHGREYQDCFFLFFSHLSRDYDKNEQYIASMFKRFGKLKSFV